MAEPFDPAFGYPFPGQQQVGSFYDPQTIPNADATTGEIVCIPVARAWLPLVLGALDQLRNPSTWNAPDNAALSTVLTWVQDLVGRAAGADDCMMLRWSDADCAVEQSTDGGSTWTKISGWPSSGAPDCLHPTFRVDASGNLQFSFDGGSTWTTVTGWPPPTPPNPSGASTDQQACNIATHIAQDIIQGALVSAISSFDTSLSEGVAASSIIALIPGFGPEMALTIDAAIGIVYLIYTTGSIGDYRTASTDPLLAQQLQCAVYNVISSDGAITAANYASVVSAIAAIAYTPSDVQTAINDFITNLGLNGMLAAQQLGGLTTGDCSGCGSGGVAILNGTDDYITGSGRLLNRTLSQDWTLCVWVKADSSAASSQGFIFAEGDSGATQPTMQVYQQFSAGADNQKINMEWYSSTPGFTWAGEKTNGTVPWNAWHHVAIIHTGGGAYGYHVDGVVVGSTHTDPETVAIRVGDGNTYIGACQGSPFIEWFKGKLADMRIYHSALNTTQTGDIAAAGVNGYLPVGSPVHWWKFDDGSGTSAADSGSSPAALTWHGSGSHWSTV